MRIHLTNVTGMGAMVLARSLMPHFLSQRRDPVTAVYALPDTDVIETANLRPGIFVPYTRRLPRSVSRLLEVTVFGRRFAGAGRCLVLGDLPLRHVADQTVFVQNPFLVRELKGLRGAEWLRVWLLQRVFAMNKRFASAFVVQSQVMADALSQRFDIPPLRIHQIAQPCPTWLLDHINSGVARYRPARSRTLTLFYPARNYPHKNHGLLGKIKPGSGISDVVSAIQITVPPERTPNAELDLLTCLGEIGPDQVIRHYLNCDALLFLSKEESYGLPLIEAMVLGLPIVCADRPYARVLCGETAIYFDPDSVQSLESALRELAARLAAGWVPDWTEQKRGIPTDWATVADLFLDVMMKEEAAP